MRHHGFKGKIPFCLYAFISASVRNELSFFAPLSERSNQFNRDLVWIDILTQVDVVSPEMLCQGRLSGSIWPGNHEQEGFAQSPAPPDLGYGTSCFLGKGRLILIWMLGNRPQILNTSVRMILNPPSVPRTDNREPCS